MPLDPSDWVARTTLWDEDNVPDLFMIKKAATGTGRTEVHVFSGASQYATPILQTGTALHYTDHTWQFVVADWDLDGRPDLWCIHQNNANGRCDIHILSGASNFQTFILQATLPLGASDFSCGDFLATPPFRGAYGRPNLMLVKRRATGTNRTEVHVLDGASNFQQMVIQKGTALHETGSGPGYQFQCGDWDGEGYLDLVCATSQGGGEIHVLSGRQSYDAFKYQSKIDTPSFREMSNAGLSAFATCGGAVMAKLTLFGLAATIPPTGGASLAIMLGTYGASTMADLLCVVAVENAIHTYRERSRAGQVDPSAGPRGGRHGDPPSDRSRPDPTPRTQIRDLGPADNQDSSTSAPPDTSSNTPGYEYKVIHCSAESIRSQKDADRLEVEINKLTKDGWVFMGCQLECMLLFRRDK